MNKKSNNNIFFNKNEKLNKMLSAKLLLCKTKSKYLPFHMYLENIRIFWTDNVQSR